MTKPQRSDPQARLARRVEEMRARYPDDDIVQEVTADIEVALEESQSTTEQLAQETSRVEQGQEALADERINWQRLFDLGPDAYVVTDRAGIVTEFNQKAKELLQLRDNAKRSVLVLKLARSVRPAFQRMLRDPSGAGSSPLTVRLSGRRNANFRGELRCVPAGSGRLLWLIGDISETERTRELLEAAIKRETRAAEQLRAVDEMRRAFLLAVSHDLRAPIAAVATFASVLRSDSLSDDDRQRALAQLEETAYDTIAMLRDLLDYERFEEPSSVRRQRVDVSAVVKRALASVDVDEHTLEAHVPSITASIDTTVVERIIANLVRNASQHTPDGTTIWVQCRQEPDGLLLVVEDDGPGIPSEDRDDVFLLFHRDRSRRETSGLGVGLALVRRFAELHGGYARVEARRGGGASFQVLLHA